MTEMAAAPGAVHFGAGHAVAAVDGGADGAVERREEAGPASAAFELPFGHEQPVAAAGTRERAGAMFLQQRTGAWPLGRMLAQHGVLFRSERPAPLVFRFRDRERCLLHDQWSLSTGRVLPTTSIRPRVAGRDNPGPP